MATVTEWIGKIAEGLRIDSGYPYPDGYKEADPNRTAGGVTSG